MKVGIENKTLVFQAGAKAWTLSLRSYPDPTLWQYGWRTWKIAKVGPVLLLGYSK